jgi:hypothetical protein
MHQREGHVGIERLTGLYAALHEVDGPAGDLRVDQAALVQVIHGELATLLAFAACHDVHEGDTCRPGGGR